ncbi:MAG: hypothetical protein RI935_187 [Candidatus Parcubacteria bacterium]|jgi:hypothetical protein
MQKGAATQEFVSVERVRDGIVTLKNGELRAIVITNSLNLGLKSEDEVSAILNQFQNFLNSLDFPVQFFIESRKLNIENYLNLLQDRSKNVKEDLLKIQIHEYMGFIKKFTDESNIMTKHFFISIPYATVGQALGGSSLLNLSFGDKKNTDNNSFEAARIQLEQRVAVVIQGLSRFGVRAKRLNTEELVELLYKLFNPGEQSNHVPKVNNS